jgi:uncharacterized membrane protein YhaH (DUF805 family)
MFNTTLNDDRGTFFMWNMLSFAIIIAGAVVGSMIMDANPEGSDVVLLITLLSIFAGYSVKICAYARRMNDLFLSKWHLLGLIVPIWSLVLWCWMQFTPSKMSATKSTDELVQS